MKNVSIGKVDVPNLGIAGTEHADTFNGSAYADIFHGRGGDDIMYGGGGDDQLFGDAGNDTFSGGIGKNILDGGTGNDWFIGGPGQDTMIGGLDFDTVSYAGSANSVNITWDNINNRLYGEDGDSAGDVYSRVEKFVGTDFGDRLDVSKYTDFDFSGVTLDGGKGGDILIGGRGDDILTGGAGGDRLDGGNGNDLLTGGTGPEQDLFVFHEHQTGSDLLTDFQPGIDKIFFDFKGSNPFGSDGQLLASPQLDYTFDENGPYNDHLILVGDLASSFKLYEIDYSGPGTAGVPHLLATLTNGVILHTDDFILG